MDIKILRTVIEIETVAVPIEGTNKLVLVYSRKPGETGRCTAVVMEKEVYEKANSASLSPYTFFPSHLSKELVYTATFWIITKKGFEKMMSGSTHWSKEEPRDHNFEFGKPLPENLIIVGFCGADNTYYTVDEKLINVPIVDTFYYDSLKLTDVIANVKNMPDVDALKYRSYEREIIENPTTSNALDFIPGNGTCAALMVKLSDEDYIAFRNLKHTHLRKDFVIDHSSLAAYRAEPSELEEEDDE